MSKELEAYFKIDNTICLNSQNIKFGIDVDEHIDCQNVNELVNCLETIKKALEEREAIDNVNPSEVLNYLEELEKMIEYFTRLDYVEPIVRNEIHDKFKDIYWHKLPHLNTIKQALLKAQANARSEEILQKYYQEGITLDSVRALKQEKDNYKKVLEIVFKKNVDMLLIKKYDNVSDYNSAVWLSGREKLTEEEFNFLKEVLE